MRQRTEGLDVELAGEGGTIICNVGGFARDYGVGRRCPIIFVEKIFRFAVRIANLIGARHHCDNRQEGRQDVNCGSHFGMIYVLDYDP